VVAVFQQAFGEVAQHFVHVGVRRVKAGQTGLAPERCLAHAGFQDRLIGAVLHGDGHGPCGEHEVLQRLELFGMGIQSQLQPVHKAILRLQILQLAFQVVDADAASLKCLVANQVPVKWGIGSNPLYNQLVQRQLHTFEGHGSILAIADYFRNQ